MCAQHTTPTPPPSPHFNCKPFRTHYPVVSHEELCDYNITSDSTSKIYREIARPSQFMLSTNTQALCVVCVCFRPPRITILCSRLNRKPSTLILDPKEPQILVAKKSSLQLGNFRARGQRIIFSFSNFCPQNPMKFATESSRETGKKVSSHIFLLPFFTFIR